ncbi:chemotaxis protein CheX [Maledivibacter halophilus]|uniref:Chemotaxis protein CheX n=1 Tax=Maledivibacter halophilus TaxID=36842 RepID=A0A1T5LHU2_9FIRM|nr:chemotaxis protein CheX [Maledivibacter halophilus]SKC75563.1 chemotaxis protein CheX [Maledivibacter halophilus]
MKAEYINPFIKASKDILTQMTHVEYKVGKPTLKSSPCNANNIVILIGITGDIKGQAMINLNKSVALNVVSNMMGGMEIAELNDISKSALSELGNMILGNSATLLFNAGIKIDITPPTLMIGDNLSISSDQMKVISVPLEANEEKIELNIFVKE